jgi:hypothetical protein
MPCSVRAGGFQHLFWPEAGFCQQTLAVLTRGGICVSWPDNATHNISIHRESGRLAGNPPQSYDSGGLKVSAENAANKTGFEAVIYL